MAYGHNGGVTTHSSEDFGVSDGSVRLVEHSAEWSRQFVQLHRELVELLGDLADGVEHVGSTAVPGLVAKPMVDVAVGLHDLDDVAAAGDRLTGAGFDFRGDFGEDGGVIYAQGPADGRTAMLHLVEFGGFQWKRYLRFRDALRADPEMRRRYDELKRELAARHPDDRLAYLAGKARLIRGIVPAGPSAADESH